MRIQSLVAVLALALAAPRLAAQAPAPIRDTVAYTVAATALRAEADPAARVLTNLPAAWPVRVAACIVGWCDVTTGSMSGYILADSLTLTAPRGAPVPPRATLTRDVGIGVDLTPRVTLGFAAGPRFRVVPEVSYLSQGSKSYGNTTQIATYIVDATDAQLWLGSGFYYVLPLAVRPAGAPCLLYVGPRLGVAFVRDGAKVESLTIPSDARSSRVDFWAGFTVGAELVLSRRVSVGVEAQATKVFPGSPQLTGLTATSPGIGQSWVDFETRGTLVLRFYP